MLSRSDTFVRATILAASILTLTAAPALAGDDIMAGFYGNTVVSIGGVLESHTHYRADHTFDVTASAMGQTFSDKGTWQIDGKGELCRTYQAPPRGMPNPLCIPAEAHKPGDAWTVSVNGQTRNMTLKAGIQ